MRVGLCLLLLCVGCTTVNSYAVMAPQSAFRDSTGCFRQCQLLRAGGTNTYLNCVRACPGTWVVDGESCEDVDVDKQYLCTTEHNKSFSLLLTILAVGVLVVGIAVIGAAADHNSNNTSM